MPSVIARRQTSLVHAMFADVRASGARSSPAVTDPSGAGKARR